MGWFRDTKSRLMAISRQKKLDHFYSLFQEGQTVLDVGVAMEKEKVLAAQNQFLKTYRYDSNTYTGLGVQNLEAMSKLFPDKRFVQYPGGKFPFPDKQFDWVFSNAVIEHVGDEAAQLLFLNEMVRVAKRVFFTTPNLYFPVELHTNAIFLHWYPDLFYKWYKRKRPRLSRQTLNLLSLGKLLDLLQQSNAREYSIRKSRVLGIPLTFTVTCSDRLPGTVAADVCETTSAATV